MNKFLVVVFADAAGAFKGKLELQALHADGTATIYGLGIFQRGTNGTFTTLQQNEQRPLAPGVGALISTLVTLFAGPLQAALDLNQHAGGTLGVGCALRAEVSDEFLDLVQRELSPGKAALIAEISEEWVVPLDTRMAAIGGKVVRESRADFIDDLLERRVNAAKAELAQRRAERENTQGEALASKLSANIEHVLEKLRRAADTARARLTESKRELEAKLAALQTQATHTPPGAKQQVLQRILLLRQDFEEREQKLLRAYAVTQEALGQGELSEAQL
jgi:hypothetical protein